jgi:hypothetical protein
MVRAGPARARRLRGAAIRTSTPSRIRASPNSNSTSGSSSSSSEPDSIGRCSGRQLLGIDHTAQHLAVSGHHELSRRRRGEVGGQRRRASAWHAIVWSLAIAAVSVAVAGGLFRRRTS